MSNEIMVSENNTAIQNGSDFNIPNGYICTLDTTTIDGKVELANALNGAVSMRDLVDTAIPVKNFVTTPGVRSRTGEQCINSYLVCEDGTVYFSQSDGIARSIKVIVGLFTDPMTNKFASPIDLGIGVMIKTQVLQNGNTLKTAVPVKL